MWCMTSHTINLTLLLFKLAILWKRIWLPKWTRPQCPLPLMDRLQCWVMSLKIHLCMDFRMLTVPAAKFVRVFGRYCSFLVVVSHWIVSTYIRTQTWTQIQVYVYLCIYTWRLFSNSTHWHNHVDMFNKSHKLKYTGKNKENRKNGQLILP